MKKVIKKYFFLALAIIMYSCNEDEKYDIIANAKIGRAHV